MCHEKKLFHIFFYLYLILGHLQDKVTYLNAWKLQENADERAKREGERKKYYVANVPHHKKPSKLSQDAKNWIGKIKELKAHDTADGKKVLLPTLDTGKNLQLLKEFFYFRSLHSVRFESVE